ncbi:hypothetical protein BU23DRAFT_192987 [Bimuria novae-zelandiae CBS 107.79]|uniref:Uncharacterized protein n=1 Tax=Bimuria novae-zelandiae CBS 107.79 TaxID=1447943 RepID=A0A6A5VTG0_9PLEO|nr:hypothetical protein BU23DRAFT_192987 [Bimuria novae-zelandiae CBS 107.79]
MNAQALAVIPTDAPDKEEAYTPRTSNGLNYLPWLAKRYFVEYYGGSNMPSPHTAAQLEGIAWALERWKRGPGTARNRTLPYGATKAGTLQWMDVVWRIMANRCHPFRFPGIQLSHPLVLPPASHPPTGHTFTTGSSTGKNMIGKMPSDLLDRFISFLPPNDQYTVWRSPDKLREAVEEHLRVRWYFPSQSPIAYADVIMDNATPRLATESKMEKCLTNAENGTTCTTTPFGNSTNIYPPAIFSQSFSQPEE